MKILILKPSSLGDVVQALPVLRLLKQSLPRSEIHWWIDSRLTPLLEADPDLAGLIPFERDALRSPAGWPRAWSSLRQARSHRFDLVIDLQALARSGLMAWLTNGSETVGLEDWREGAPLFYDRAVPRPSPMTHAVDWYLSVLPRLGIPVHHNFNWLPERPEAVSIRQRNWQDRGIRWVTLQPGARWDNKRWPVNHFAETVRLLSREFPGLRFVILGSRGERLLGESIEAVGGERCLNVAGETSLPEMVEWVRGSALMVSNDTGPMHVAAALSRPVVAVFGPTEPRRTGPYGQIREVLRASLPCVPCMKSTCSRPRPLECLHEVPPTTVVERAVTILRRLPAGPPALAAAAPPP